MKTQNCKLEVVVTAHYNYYGQYAIQALLGMCKISCSIYSCDVSVVYALPEPEQAHSFVLVRPFKGALYLKYLSIFIITKKKNGNK